MSRKRSSEAALNKMGKPELKSEVKRLEFTITKRGKQIGMMYSLVRRLMDNHPDSIMVTQVEDAKNQVATLQTQLTQARVALTRVATEHPTAVVEGAPPGNKLGDCVVCFEALDDTDHKPLVLNCGHILCEACLTRGQEHKPNFSCPKCRTPIVRFITLYL